MVIFAYYGPQILNLCVYIYYISKNLGIYESYYYVKYVSIKNSII